MKGMGSIRGVGFGGRFSGAERGFFGGRTTGTIGSIGVDRSINFTTGLIGSFGSEQVISHVSSNFGRVTGTERRIASFDSMPSPAQPRGQIPASVTEISEPLEEKQRRTRRYGRALLGK